MLLTDCKWLKSVDMPLHFQVAPWPYCNINMQWEYQQRPGHPKWKLKIIFVYPRRYSCINHIYYFPNRFSNIQQYDSMPKECGESGISMQNSWKILFFTITVYIMAIYFVYSVLINNYSTFTVLMYPLFTVLPYIFTYFGLFTLTFDRVQCFILILVFQ